jgi:hypothetical protein
MVHIVTTVFFSTINMRWMIPESQGQKLFCWLLCSNQFWSHKFSLCICAGISDLWGKAAGTWSWSPTFFPYRCLECLQVTHMLCGECSDTVTAVSLLYDENSCAGLEVLPTVYPLEVTDVPRKNITSCWCIPGLTRTLKMETVRSSETSVNFYQTT